MKTRDWIRKHFAPLFGVLVLVAIIFYPLIVTRDYLYDDVTFVSENPDIFLINSLRRCFSFILQPSKPVTNFFLALGVLIGNGRVSGQHFLSLLLHCLVGAVWYFNLVQWGKRSKFKATPGFYLGLIALFLTLPVLSEALQIAQFRGEILATLFASLAILAAQHLAVTPKKSRLTYFYYAGIFLCLGLSQLSKEVFAVFVPPLIVLFFWLPGAKAPGRAILRKFIFVMVAFELIWAPILYLLLRRDAAGPYTYSHTIGWAIIPPPMHIALASRSLVEYLLKLFTGTHLTVTRVLFRKSIGFTWPLWAHILTLLLGLVGSIFLCLQKGWVRLWGALFCAGWVYLAIPNANLGSEHYIYFCSFGFVVLMGMSSWVLAKRSSDHPRFIWWLGYGCVAFYSVCALETRLFECSSRLNYSRIEVEHYPEYYANWVGYTSALLNNSAPQEEIKIALAECRRTSKDIWGEQVEEDVLKIEFLYDLIYGTFDETQLKFIQMMKAIRTKRESAFFEIQYAKYLNKEGRCDLAMGVLARAEKLGEGLEITHHYQTAFKRGMDTYPSHCKYFPKGFMPRGNRIPAAH